MSVRDVKKTPAGKYTVYSGESNGGQGAARMTAHLARVVDALYRHDCRPKRGRGDQWRARCPGPCHRRGDIRPSLVIKGVADKVLINCFVRCHTKEIVAALGLSLSDLFASSPTSPPERPHRRRRMQRYQYEDIHGQLLAEKLRYEPKDFRWYSPAAEGRFRWRKAEGIALYRIPHLIDAYLVLVVEGEKAVDRLTELGFVATCPPNGASTWLETYSEALWRAGGDVVVVIPDNDRRGRDHARRVVQACHRFRPNFAALSIEPGDPWAAWPSAEPDDDEVQPLRAKLLELDGLPHTGDVCDWFDAGHTAAGLRELIDAALDLDEIERAKLERRRRVDRKRQRRHRARLRAAATCHSI